MLVVGAGGHAKEVLDSLHKSGIPLEEISFYDDTDSCKEDIFGRFKIIKSIEEAKIYFDRAGRQFCLGIGNPIFRQHLLSKFKMIEGEFYPIFDKSSIVSEYATFINVDIMSFAFVGPDSYIGEYALINSRVNIHHDVNIGAFTEISPMACILGGASIGKFCQIGSGVTILSKVNVGDNVVIGAGSVVTKDISDNSLAYGVPAKVKKLTPYK